MHSSQSQKYLFIYLEKNGKQGRIGFKRVNPSLSLLNLIFNFFQTKSLCLAGFRIESNYSPDNVVFTYVKRVFLYLNLGICIFVYLYN